MKYQKPVAWVSLIACLALGGNARAEPPGAVRAAMQTEPGGLAKLSVQTVLRADGFVVDRLVEAERPSSQGVAAQNRSVPDTPEAWLARMIDPTKNGLAIKQPELFAEWLDAVTEPRFMTALASIAITPETYTNSIGKMVDPDTARNWAEFADPRVFLRWMAAGTDPRFYQGIFDRMTHDGKVHRWGVYLGSRDAMTRPVDASRGTANAALNDQHWKQLPVRSNSNPWLSNSLNYRY